MDVTLHIVPSRYLDRASVSLPGRLAPQRPTERQAFVNPITTQATDRREFKRFPLHLRAYFWWKSSDGKKNFATGVTRDIGPHGVFIIGKTEPEDHTFARVELILPSDSARTMKIRGRVVRTEPLNREQNYGFAIYAEKRLTITRGSGNYAKQAPPLEDDR